jgi:hypothetical protein
MFTTIITVCCNNDNKQQNAELQQELAKLKDQLSMAQAVLPPTRHTSHSMYTGLQAARRVENLDRKAER